MATFHIPELRAYQVANRASAVHDKAQLRMPVQQFLREGRRAPAGNTGVRVFELFIHKFERDLCRQLFYRIELRKCTKEFEILLQKKTVGEAFFHENSHFKHIASSYLIK